MPTHKAVDNRLDKTTAIAALWGLKWDIFPVKIVEPAPRFLRDAKKGDGTPAFPWARWPGGVFVTEGIEGSKDLVPVRGYDPTACAGSILLEATRINLENQEALLGFVNKWGLLGIAEPDNAIQLWDSVFLTRAQLHNIKRLAGWLQAMQHGKWKSSAIPPLDEVRKLLADVRVEPKNRRELYHLAFQQEFNKKAWGCPLRPLLLSDGRQFRRYLRPLRLLDVLYIELWQAAFARDTVLRQCAECKGLFSVKKSNRLKAFCTPACKNRRNFRRWYASPRNREKLRQKRKAL